MGADQKAFRVDLEQNHRHRSLYIQIHIIYISFTYHIDILTYHLHIYIYTYTHTSLYPTYNRHSQNFHQALPPFRRVPAMLRQVGGGPLQHPRGQRGVPQLPGGHRGGAARGRLQWGAGGVHGAVTATGGSGGWGWKNLEDISR